MAGSAITANRTATIPLLTGNDQFTMDAFSTTLTNKTIVAASNTLTDTSAAAGDILKHNGTKFVRLGLGTANQVLTTNAGATDIAWASPTGGGVSASSTNTWSAVQTFNDTDLALRNVANTFSSTISAGAQTASNTFTFPVTASDVIATIAATQTLTNKSLSGSSNTFTNIPDSALSSNVVLLTGAQTVTGAKTFNDTDLLLRNPANTFSSTISAGAQTAGNTFTFPVTASDVITTIAATQTLTNKTIAAGSNTITGIVDANISAHTTTKITTTSKTLLNTSIAYIDQANVFGAFTQEFQGAVQQDTYQDIKTITIPSAPATNFVRMYAKQIDSTNYGLYAQALEAGSNTEIRIF